MSNTEAKTEAMRSAEAKAEILQRIRSAHALTAEDGARQLSHDVGIDYVAPGTENPVPRDYFRDRDTPRTELIELAHERIADYKANVITCGGSDAEIARTIAQQLEQLGANASAAPLRVGVPEGLEPGWLADFSADWEVVADQQLSTAQLEALDVIVTSSAVTSAETGTIFLDGSSTSGRRALTLIPDIHVCVVPVSTIVHGVPEAISALNAANPTTPITMISGPSATSDIELNRVEGVHGPRTLIVIIAG